MIVGSVYTHRSGIRIASLFQFVFYHSPLQRTTRQGITADSGQYEANIRIVDNSCSCGSLRVQQGSIDFNKAAVNH